MVWIIFVHLLVIEAIFVGEKIQDLVPLAANGLLILGQGNIWLVLSKSFCLPPSLY